MLAILKRDFSKSWHLLHIRRCNGSSTTRSRGVWVGQWEVRVIPCPVNSDQWRDADQLVQPHHQADTELGNTGSCRASNEPSRSVKLHNHWEGPFQPGEVLIQLQTSRWFVWSSSRYHYSGAATCQYWAARRSAAAGICSRSGGRKTECGLSHRIHSSLPETRSHTVRTVGWTDDELMMIQGHQRILWNSRSLDLT